MSSFSVFLLSCHGNVFRKFALIARQVGMKPEEYTIIYFISDPTSGNIGNYGWKRGDEFDLVRDVLMFVICLSVHTYLYGTPLIHSYRCCLKQITVLRSFNSVFIALNGC